MSQTTHNAISRSCDAHKDGPDNKRLKIDDEDEFPYSDRITILQSYGTVVSHVPTSEFEKIIVQNTGVHDDYRGASIQTHNFNVEKPLVRFLAHWIHHRDSEEAITATMNRQTQRRHGVLDEEWLDFLIKVMNFCDDPKKFISDITDSLVHNFMFLLDSGDRCHIKQMYSICKACCKTHALIRIFANEFVYCDKEFLMRTPRCRYDWAVQKHMQGWLADVFCHNKDWNRLPSDLRNQSYGTCFHHAHGKEKDCYVSGRIIDRG
ncbi:unnamed protein product [Aureobasidium vineae]|uniref:Uncharacterized protein n=1 Tax=Aureobasidium vineae TaxID=2773715 RepID=A0A9N8PHU7_9PEZI|nr:unnamed protein product [Aureobasidium vineae]